jgi:uncharacterized membrane protein YeiB
MTVVTAIFLMVLIVLFVGLVGFQLLGHHFGVQWRARTGSSDGIGGGTSAVEASLFALLGLLIAFTVSGGETRLQARRQLIVEEASAIEGAYLRIDLLPAQAQPALREQFRRYTDARLELFAHYLQRGQRHTAHDRAIELQHEIWKHAAAAAMATSDTRPAIITLPAITRMIDITIARDASLHTHVPMALFALLVALSFGCAFFAGLEMSKNPRPSPLHIAMFAGMLALTCYVIANVEFPRLGFVRLRSIDALLSQVRQRMG